jgi:hypothetical protein
MKAQNFVMPAWIAGIQIRKDASGDFHVDLDSSIPCWNDAIEEFCLNRARCVTRYFRSRREARKVGQNASTAVRGFVN